jgi:hypothetical protein
MSVSTWADFVYYNLGDQVRNGTSIVYVCILANINQPPPNVTYWSAPTPSTVGITSLNGLDATSNTGILTLSSADATFTPTPSTGVLDMAITFPTPPTPVPLVFGTAAIPGDGINFNFGIPLGQPSATYSTDAPVQVSLQVPDGTTGNRIDYAKVFDGPTQQYIIVSFTAPVSNGITPIVCWSVLADNSIPVIATTTPI